MRTTYKTAKTIKEYRVSYRGYDLVIPVGTVVSNNTAMGNDDNYRFLVDDSGIARKHTGLLDSMLRHDLTYYGLNIPSEYCEPYKED